MPLTDHLAASAELVMVKVAEEAWLSLVVKTMLLVKKLSLNLTTLTPTKPFWVVVLF